MEAIAYQQAAIEELERWAFSVPAMHPMKDKRARVCASRYIKNGTVKFPRKGCEQLLTQLVGFRGGRNTMMHTFRAAGITVYLDNGGALEHAQSMAAHESPRTTKLYDRTKERLTQDEVVQFFDSTVVRAPVSTAGAKGGKKIRRSRFRCR